MNDYSTAAKAQDQRERFARVGNPTHPFRPLSAELLAQARANHQAMLAERGWTERQWEGLDPLPLKLTLKQGEEILKEVYAEVPQERLSESDVDALAERYSEGRTHKPKQENFHG